MIEYKGGHLEKGDDTQEKDNVGQLWAAQSNGQCLFLMAVQKAWEKSVATNTVQLSKNDPIYCLQSLIAIFTHAHSYTQFPQSPALPAVIFINTGSVYSGLDYP